MTRRLLGFAGKARSGKSTAGAFITQQYGFRPASFAGCLKEMLRAMFTYQGVDPDVIEEMLEGHLKGADVPALGTIPGSFKPNSPRRAMQTLGTEWGRQLMDPNLWIDAEMRHQNIYNPGCNLVFADIRFPNEAKYIQDNGGFVVKLVRHASEDDLGTVAASHGSENQDIPYNMIIQNNTAIEHLQDRLRKLIQYLGWED